MRLFGFAAVASFGLVLAVAGCATYADALARGQRAFEQGEHDRALAILRSMQNDVERLPVPERARYAYLRGMTDYRIGYRADARHWLALGAEIEKQMPGALAEGWAKRLAAALGELDEQVYEKGIASLSNAPDSQPRSPDADEDDSSDGAGATPAP